MKDLLCDVCGHFSILVNLTHSLKPVQCTTLDNTTNVYMLDELCMPGTFQPNAKPLPRPIWKTQFSSLYHFLEAIGGGMVSYHGALVESGVSDLEDVLTLANLSEREFAGLLTENVGMSSLHYRTMRDSLSAFLIVYLC